MQVREESPQSIPSSIVNSKNIWEKWRNQLPSLTTIHFPSFSFHTCLWQQSHALWQTSVLRICRFFLGKAHLFISRWFGQVRNQIAKIWRFHTEVGLWSWLSGSKTSRAEKPREMFFFIALKTHANFNLNRTPFTRMVFTLYLDNMLLKPKSYPKLLCGDAIFKEVPGFVDFVPPILH